MRRRLRRSCSRRRRAIARIAIVARRWTPEDFAGAALAVGEAENDDEARAFAQAARDAGAPVNVIDRPAFCDFSFGAIVNRSPLVIGISTDGAAPVFGQALRAAHRGADPGQFRRLGEGGQGLAAALCRARRRFPPAPDFWERFANLALASAGRPPAPSDLDGAGRRRGAERGAEARARSCWSAAAPATPIC